MTVPESERIMHPLLKIHPGNLGILRRKYYDEPEGKDLVGKLIATNRYALVCGSGMAWGDCALHTKPSTLTGALARFGFWVTPAVCLATTYTVITYAATTIRGKDDKWNPILGGFCCAGVIGAWRRNHITGYTLGLFFAIAAAVKRLSKEEGWDFFYLPPKSMGDFKSHKYDWTIFGEGEKNYESWEKGSKPA